MLTDSSAQLNTRAPHICGNRAYRCRNIVSSQRSQCTPRVTALPHPDIAPSTSGSPHILQQVCDASLTHQLSNHATNPAAWAAAAGLGLAAYALKRSFESGSRAYKGNVGDEYDAWTQEGVLEYYWGEHIHLGYYTDEQRSKGSFKANFKEAKYEFVRQMLQFSKTQQVTKVLDVGCGFGGASRMLASMHPQAQVTGITLSPKQVERGTQLAQQRRLSNVEFKVMDALAMSYPDNSFDLVWACESGEHMPDKKKYIDEMTRVLKPGGTLVIACWCQREEGPEAPLTPQERRELQFLYDEWAHPYFISIQDFARLMQGTGQLGGVETSDWTPQTLPSWRHSIVVGAQDPWFVVARPHLWYKVLRDAVTLERMHRAFASGLMQYGMMRATKLLPEAGAGAGSSNGDSQ